MSLAVDNIEEQTGLLWQQTDRLLEVLEDGLQVGTDGDLDYTTRSALLELLLRQLDPARVLIVTPSAQLQARVDYLLAQPKARALTDQEKAELEYYFKLEHIVRMAKIQAAQKLEFRRLLIAL